MNEDLPHCYGKLDVVFPEGKDGLRESPESCFLCFYKTRCLKEAMKSNEGIVIQEKILEKAEDSKLITFFERWKRKKYLSKKRGENDKV